MNGHEAGLFNNEREHRISPCVSSDSSCTLQDPQEAQQSYSSTIIKFKIAKHLLAWNPLSASLAIRPIFPLFHSWTLSHCIPSPLGTTYTQAAIYLSLVTSRTFEEDFQLLAWSAVCPSTSLKNYKRHAQLPFQRLWDLPSALKISINCCPWDSFLTHTISGTFRLLSKPTTLHWFLHRFLVILQISACISFSRWEQPLTCVHIWHLVLILLAISQGWCSWLRDIHVTSKAMRWMKTGTLSTLTQVSDIA